MVVRNAGRCRENEIISTLPPMIRNAYKRERVVRPAQQSRFELTKDPVVSGKGISKMKYLLPFVLTVVLLAVDGKVVPASDVAVQQTGSLPFQWPDLTAVQTRLQDLTTQFQQNFKGNEHLEMLKEHGNQFTNHLQTMFDGISEKVKEKVPDLQNMFDNLKNNLNDAMAKLGTENNTMDQLNQMSTTFHQNMQTLMTESKKAFEVVDENSGKVKEDIAKMAKNVFEMAAKAAEDVSHHLQEHTTETAPSN